MRSVIDDAAPSAAPRRDIAAFPPTQQLLNTADAGKYLSISRTKVYELINSGALESVTIGRSRRVSVAQLQRFSSPKADSRRPASVVMPARGRRDV